MNVEQVKAEATAMLEANPKVKRFQLVGSAEFHPEPKDVDFLVEVDAPGFLWNAAQDEGATMARWVFGPDWITQAGQYDDQEDSVWGSLRNGDVNLIVTVRSDWYDRAALANEVCVALKLMDKGDRIVVYRVVRDGYDATEANEKRDGTA